MKSRVIGSINLGLKPNPDMMDYGELSQRPELSLVNQKDHGKCFNAKVKGDIKFKKAMSHTKTNTDLYFY